MALKLRRTKKITEEEEGDLDIDVQMEIGDEKLHELGSAVPNQPDTHTRVLCHGNRLWWPPIYLQKKSSGVMFWYQNELTHLTLYMLVDRLVHGGFQSYRLIFNRIFDYPSLKILVFALGWVKSFVIFCLV